MFYFKFLQRKKRISR